MQPILRLLRFLYNLLTLQNSVCTPVIKLYSAGYLNSIARLGLFVAYNILFFGFYLLTCPYKVFGFQQSYASNYEFAMLRNASH